MIRLKFCVLNIFSVEICIFSIKKQADIESATTTFDVVYASVGEGFCLPPQKHGRRVVAPTVKKDI